MPPPKLTLDTPVTSLDKFNVKRFGEYSARKLAGAIASFAGKPDPSRATVEDLLGYLPVRYEDRSRMTRISELRTGVEASLELKVKVAGGFQVQRRASRAPGGLYIYEITASDPDRTGRPVVVWWFVSGRNARNIIDYNNKRFTSGSRFIAFGEWEWDARRSTFSLKISKPDELELIATRDASTVDEAGAPDPALAAIHVGRRVPVYRKLGDFTPKRLREINYAVLERLESESIRETLPNPLKQRNKLVSREQALRSIHFPSEEVPIEEYQTARSPAHRRLIFEEFFWVMFGLGLKRSARVKEPKGSTIKIEKETLQRIAGILPFKLTEAQRRAVKAIFKDLQSNAPMNRLLQGDVGSGKTIVALIAMMATMESGYQTAIMAPTEILAEQHARNIKRLLAKTPYHVELLTGSLRSSEKRKLQNQLVSGDIDLVVGTHALIQEGVAFKKLGLAVIDEQHRFGVMQRAELRSRGLNPDVLVMTATPIPRSLAMTVYGDLDVSVIDEMPPGRTPVKTVVVGEDQRRGVYKGVEREVKGGRQVYVVYPLVKESEKMDLRDATRMYEHLRDQVFPQFTVGLLHGKMKAGEKEEIMRRFVAGEIQILVSTTVIEVGVDVSNASVMIIEHAERFGLSQLHQLRGRVGRGAEQSSCVLLTADKKTSVAEERLGIMAKTNDGFLIAEKDLEIRGPGEIMGTRQSGLPEFRIANLVRDMPILEAARREADYYLSEERDSAETRSLIKQIESTSRFSLAGVG